MELLERFRRHDRLALARLISLAARGEVDDEALAQLAAPAQPARVLAVTGSAGVGKSTLIGKLIELLRGKTLAVAVLACDPQSPLSGGALLGDRFRMGQKADDGVFIRSLAAMGGHGAIADHLQAMIRLLEAFGFEVIIIETVGAGQGDVAVRELADAVVLLLQPETGDDVQWEKAGVLEIADVIVVHKADMRGAEETLAQVRGTLDLAGAHALPILGVSSKSGAGLEELWSVLAALPLRRQVRPVDKDLAGRAKEAVERGVRDLEARKDEDFFQLLEAWRQRKVGTADAVKRLFGLLARESS